MINQADALAIRTFFLQDKRSVPAPRETQK